MKAKKLTDLTDKKLLSKKKQIKNDKVIGASFVGFTVGIAIYGIMKNGFELLTLLPLFLAYITIKNSSNNKFLESEIEKEIESRNLQ